VKIIGLDLSLTATGWAEWKDGIRNWGVIRTGPDKTVYGEVRRLQSIIKQVGDVARGADLAVIEDFAFSKNAVGSRGIGCVGYAVRMWLLNSHIPFILAGTGQLRLFCTGSGKGGEKGTMIREVYRRWQIEVDDHNAADAIGLMHIGLALTGGIVEDDLLVYQKKVLANVKRRNTDVDFDALARRGESVGASC
jgi:crossover junction endodeoxyribonuclease RuvC